MSRLRHEHSIKVRGAGKQCGPDFIPLLVAVLLNVGGCANAYTAQTHDFGSVSLNATGATYAFSATVSGVTASPVWSITGTSFSVGTITCSTSAGTATCSGTVTFTPLYPGLNTGAIYAKDSSGNLLATYAIRGVGLAPQMLLVPGTASTLAGTGVWGYANGAPGSAMFRNPSGVALDQGGNLYVADSVNQVVRKITSSAVITVAGNGQAGYSGDGGAANLAPLNNPTGLAIDAANNLFIADQGNGLIRRVDAISGLITSVAGGGSTLVTSSTTNVTARAAAFSGPQSVAVDTSGNLFISDSFHQMVDRVDATTGVITVYAGGGNGGGTDGLGDGGLASSALLNNPTGLALDAAGNLYIADAGDNMIRVVNASSGVITAVAGSGNYGYSGDSGAATSAALASPMAVRVDAGGNLYIADFGNNAIRQTTAATGFITTLMGNGTGGYTGDGGLATSATLTSPADVALGSSGNLFIADSGNNVIRQVVLSSPALAFSSIVAGTASQSKQITLLNSGNEALTLSGLTITGPFKQLPSVSSCSASSVLQAGGACSLSVQFSPVASGSFSGTLSVIGNSFNVTGTKAVPLSGIATTGSAPTATLSATSINFGTVASGATQSQSVTLTNQGTAALAISGISLGGSGAFTLTSTCGNSLAAGSSCLLGILFTPVTSINYSGTLTLTDSVGTSPQQVSLSGSGSGGPVGSVDTSALYFSSVLSTGTIAQTVTLSSTGTAPLTLAGISLTGPNSADFTIGSACGAIVASGQSCITSIYFSPSAVGLRTATLSITDNGVGSPHIIVLSGSGPTTPLQFVPVTPCRVVDTRLANGAFGGPELTAGVPRTFNIPSGTCGIPPNAAAYSLNATVVPGPALGYLEIWPTGITKPVVSTLTLENEIRANAAIVTAGVSGGIQVFVSQPSQVILDINGYFVAGGSSALSFYPVTPCRVADTRLANGPFGGPFMNGGTTRSFAVPSSACNIPATAQAYSLNFTVVPRGVLYVLTSWPTGVTEPVVSTLNAFTGKVTANAALVPAGTGGSINVAVSDSTDVIIDIDGYFAPAATGGLSFYTVNPCRALDTRLTAGQFTGTINANIGGSACSPPATAQAYVFNATVTPPGYFGYLTLWPTGSSKPIASTLNDTEGLYISNLAIVPAASGYVSAFASDPTSLLLDISGYFAP